MTAPTDGEVALRIAALYGWTPTTDPAQMDTIREKSAWDVVHQVERLVGDVRAAAFAAGWQDCARVAVRRMDTLFDEHK